jgi:hypothetical protein
VYVLCSLIHFEYTYRDILTDTKVNLRMFTLHHLDKSRKLIYILSEPNDGEEVEDEENQKVAM